MNTSFIYQCNKFLTPIQTGVHIKNGAEEPEKILYTPDFKFFSSEAEAFCDFASRFNTEFFLKENSANLAGMQIRKCIVFNDTETYAYSFLIQAEVEKFKKENPQIRLDFQSAADNSLSRATYYNF